MKDTNTVKIGTIVTAVGLKGEVKIKNYSGRPDRYEVIDTVYIRQTPYEIRSVRYQKAMVILGLEGVTDRDGAERLRGEDVFMAAEDLEELAPGEHYIRDLLGMNVVLEDGARLGTLEDIRTDTAQPLYQILTEEGKKVYLPGVGAFVRTIDEAKGTITVRLPEGLLEL